jgi:2-amino-4-hydroxy-6-hydroxymethyldihydropteridine diphosphokinase / dihydropteroate synthase
MVILGLGSNVGDRMMFLRQALAALKKIPGLTITRVAPVYISDALMPENAPVSWDKPYLNTAVRCETTLEPYDLLRQTKHIEAELGRAARAHWSPRPIDIDILAWDDRVQYDEKLHVPHEHLPVRPFALWPLADIAPRWIYPLPNAFQGKTASEIAAAWGPRFSGDAPFHTRQIMQRIDAPQLMGILNITPDSFSDGGIVDADAIVSQARRLIENGAEILDIGAEASNPQASTIDAVTEWQRLENILPALIAARDSMLIPPKISVDTRHVVVAKKALELGADWINDVSGLTNSAMRELVANHSCDVVMMHQLGIPATLTQVLPAHQNPVTPVYDWLEQQMTLLEKTGIARKRVIIDVGIGFGKTATQSLELLQHIDEFQKLETRLLVGHSRKSFLTLFTDKTPLERDVETLPVSLYLANQDVHCLRVHNVEHCARALRVARAL